MDQGCEGSYYQSHNGVRGCGMATPSKGVKEAIIKVGRDKANMVSHLV